MNTKTILASLISSAFALSLPTFAQVALPQDKPSPTAEMGETVGRMIRSVVTPGAAPASKTPPASAAGTAPSATSSTVVLPKVAKPAVAPKVAPVAKSMGPLSDAPPTPPAKAKAQDLPGLGVMPGDLAEMRIKSVKVGSDRNELIYIALSQLNKISTPFESPQIIDSSGATLKAVGQDLFLQPANEKPFTVYISDGGTGQSIGLTLVPKVNLPAQAIALQPDTPATSAHAKAEVEETVASDYVSRINVTIKQLALGKTPPGYTRSRLARSVAVNESLVIEPQYKYAGSTYDIFSYKVRSIVASPIEMREESFYSDTVRAVAFFPSALLQQSEETMVYVMADRPAKGGPQ